MTTLSAFHPEAMQALQSDHAGAQRDDAIDCCDTMLSRYIETARRQLKDIPSAETDDFFDALEIARSYLPEKV